MMQSSADNTGTPTRSGVGVEIADGGMRMVATLASADMTDNSATTTGRRWHHHLASPPTPEEALAALNELIEQALAEGRAEGTHPEGVGIALWGDVDPTRGTTLGMPHASGWEDFPLAARLADHWRTQVRLQSAATVAGLAEATSGAGRDARVMLYLHSGRTITSALIVAGAIVPGASGRAGKLGHWLVQPNGPRCSCGMVGHLDPIASAQTIVRRTIGLASGSDSSTAAMLRVSGGRAEAMSVRQVVQLAREGDLSAATVLDDAWDALAVALANLVAALDPGVIVIGGAPAEAGDAFCGPLRERLETLCGSWRPAPAILPGALEPRAALLGACLLARSE